MRINLGRISLLDPALCGGGNIPRQPAAVSAAATLIHFCPISICKIEF